MEKRRFRNNTGQTAAAVQACLKNAVQLGEAATEQLHAQRPGLAVALIVLALEELGKLVRLAAHKVPKVVKSYAATTLPSMKLSRADSN
jgi:AbiV family abortive infection protein